MAPKIKIEDVLPTGERITITLEGSKVSRTKVLQVLDLLSIMGGTDVGESSVNDDDEVVNMKDRVWNAILELYGDGTWFTLKELFNALADREPELKLTTLASYLAKFVAEGRLAKKGQKPSTMYRVRARVVQARE